MNQLERESKKSINMSYAKSGAHFVSTADTYTGDFYGLTVTASPDSLTLTTDDGYELNGSELTSSDDLSNYLPTGIFLPIHFKSIEIGTNGHVILWKY